MRDVSPAARGQPGATLLSTKGLQDGLCPAWICALSVYFQHLVLCCSRSKIFTCVGLKVKDWLMWLMHVLFSAIYC